MNDAPSSSPMDRRPPPPPVDKQATAAAQAAWTDKQQTGRQAAIADAKQASAETAKDRSTQSNKPMDQARPIAPSSDNSAGNKATWADNQAVNRQAAIAEAKQGPPVERVAGPVLTGDALRQSLNEKFMNNGLQPIQAAGFKPTAFEQRVSDGDLKGLYKQKFDAKTGDPVGFTYESKGFHKEVDRDGKTISSRQVPLEKPVVDPIDVVGPGEAKLVGKLAEATGRFVVKEAAKIAEKVVAKEAAQTVAKETITNAAKDVSAQALKSTEKEAGRGLSEGANDAVKKSSDRGGEAAARFLGIDGTDQAGKKAAQESVGVTAKDAVREGVKISAESQEVNMAKELFSIRDQAYEIALADAREIYQNYGIQINAREFGIRVHINYETLAKDAIKEGRLPSTLEINPQNGINKGIDAWDKATGIGYDVMTASGRSVLSHEKYAGKLAPDGTTTIQEVIPIVYNRFNQTREILGW